MSESRREAYAWAEPFMNQDPMELFREALDAYTSASARLWEAIALLETRSVLQCPIDPQETVDRLDRIAAKIAASTQPEPQR